MMTREERRNANKKQEKLQINSGVPSVAELTEGVPVLRISTAGELAEYINFKGILYKKVYTQV